MNVSDKINYVEFPVTDITATKRFFEKLFGWRFTDYGANYSAFSDAGLDGGFYKSDQCARQDAGSALIVFYSDALDACPQRVIDAGGGIVKPIFEFPGGRRFHFHDPSGNEFAIWSDR